MEPIHSIIQSALESYNRLFSVNASSEMNSELLKIEANLNQIDITNTLSEEHQYIVGSLMMETYFVYNQLGGPWLGLIPSFRDAFDAAYLHTKNLCTAPGPSSLVDALYYLILSTAFISDDSKRKEHFETFQHRVEVIDPQIREFLRLVGICLYWGSFVDPNMDDLKKIDFSKVDTQWNSVKQFWKPLHHSFWHSLAHITHDIAQIAGQETTI